MDLLLQAIDKLVAGEEPYLDDEVNHHAAADYYGDLISNMAVS